MNAAAKRFVRYTVPTGTYVALVKYTSIATALTSGFRKIHSDEDRQFLAHLIPLQRRGGTNIGKGLRKAKEVGLIMFCKVYV